MRAVATPAGSSAREAGDGSVAGGNSPGREAGLVSAIATPRTRMGGGGASHDEVLDGRGVWAIVRKMVRGVALPTEERPHRIDGICVGFFPVSKRMQASVTFASVRSDYVVRA